MQDASEEELELNLILQVIDRLEDMNRTLHQDKTT